MKLFKKFKAHLCWLGVFQSEVRHRAKIITLAFRCHRVIFISYIFSTTWYFAFEAQTPNEHSESLFIVLTSMLLFAWYSVLLFQSEKYAIIFDELNLVIGKSKLELMK